MSETSQKQVEANQENGKKGGVKTEEGKAISKYNALKHGLLSKEVLLASEDGKTLIEIGKKLRADLEPQTELELVLVDRITANIWRLKRVMQMEREMMEDSQEGSLGDGTSKLGQTLTHYDIAHNDIYGKLIRYEGSIEKGIYKALHELQRLQSARNGENVPPPIALDVDVSGEKENGFVS
jgi:hypothetical protein